MSTTCRSQRPPASRPDHGRGCLRAHHWSSFVAVAVAVVAAAAALVVVLLVSFALVGLSAHSRRQVGGPLERGRSDTRPAVGLAAAMLCVFAAGLIVCYGHYLIVA